METWKQVYDPLGSLGLSALVASIPIIFFFLALAVLRLKGHVAGTITVLLALGVAVFLYGMPVNMALWSAVDGFLFGLWPIAWIIVAAVFLYKITVHTGQFEIIRASVVSITEDQRLQMLMIGFSFGAFLEGAAGFGAPVAITAALLVGLGFNPLYAAGLCLIANTAPVAFGALGTPVLVAGQVSGIDASKIAAMAGRQLPFLSVIVPFWIVMIMDGVKGVKETWPAVLVAGVSFAVSQFFTSNFIGPELPDIISALVSLLSLTVFLKFWKPTNIFRFHKEEAEEEKRSHQYTTAQIIRAWSPFIILTIVVTVWSVPAFKSLFAKDGPLFSTILSFPIDGLNKLVIKTAPIAAKDTAMPAVYSWNVISAGGTAALLSGILSMLLLGVRAKDGVSAFVETLNELKRPIYTIGSVLAFAFVANYSGLSSTLGLYLAGTGEVFPFFSPVLGWLGVFLTGSDTSSNALFCALQGVTAQQLGISDILAIGSNSSGGVTGKMISPQSIAVACAAVGLVGHESELFRFTLKHSLLMVTVVGIIVMLQAYVFTWMIPT